MAQRFVVEAPGIRVPAAEAEATRRMLASVGRLRTDLQVLRDGEHVVFPVDDGPDHFAFQTRAERAKAYTDFLDWPDISSAPRAFDVLGDIVLIKIPDTLWAQRGDIGHALLKFHRARAVFHDGGVKGPYRIRELTRIAGEGDSLTEVQENGVRLHVDPGKAYYSPRLASERARIAELVRPGETFLDMFGGVGPQAVQCAKSGAVVTCVDLNPDAARLAKQNAASNKVSMAVLCADARALDVGRFDRINMNLPHGALDFLGEALRYAAPGASLHVHAMVANDDVDSTTQQLLGDLAANGQPSRVTAILVRAYSAVDSHMVFDVRLP